MLTLGIGVSTLGARLNKLEVLLASIASQTFLPHQIVIIAQSDDQLIGSEIQSIAIKYSLNISVHLSSEKGLSKSRNLATKILNTDLIILSDDDIEYDSSAFENVIGVFSAYPDIHIATFKIHLSDDRDVEYKNYNTNIFIHNVKTSFRVWSPEIVYRRDIFSNTLLFDEAFGLGARWPTGEENILLIDSLKQGLKLMYFPIIFAFHPPESSGYNLDSSQMINKGAMFARMFDNKGLLFAIGFCIKKIFSREADCFSPKYMGRGFIEYKTHKHLYTRTKV